MISMCLDTSTGKEPFTKKVKGMNYKKNNI